jgi:hypothetical protein
MNNKKHGCAYCEQRWRNRSLNYALLLRIITHCRNQRKVWETSCVRYGEEQVLAGIKGTGDD